MSGKDRRQFLQTAGATVAATSAVALSAQKASATAKQRLRVAVIGVGSQGTGHLSRFRDMQDVELVYLCDPDELRLAEAGRQAPGAKLVSDLRRILDDKTVDAVSIATPDHWHAPAAIMACDAGKHVYVEKPCCHNFREGQLLVQAARRNKRIVQHGTQQRSSRFTADAIQMLREGIIGDVLVAKAWNIQRRANIGREKPSQPPAGFDYDLWTGPAVEVPFRRNCHHYTWRWWYNFGSGDMGNDGVHEIDYARWGLGVETLPTLVSSVGGKYFFDDDQQFPDTQTAVFEYPSATDNGPRRQLIFEMRLWSRSYPYNVDSGAEYYGTKGRMFLSKRGKLEVFDDRNRRIENPQPASPAHLHQEDHYADFIDAIQTNRAPQAEIEDGFRSTALCNLGNLANRLGRSIQLDIDRQVIIGDDEANSMLARHYRDGGHWAVPKNV